jgi:hypothetical protein
VEFNVSAPNGGSDDFISNNTETRSLTVPSTPYSFNLKVTTDYYPSENTYTVRDSSGSMIYSGGSWANSNTQGTVINNNMCFIAGCYEVKIMDSFGDGQGFTAGSTQGIDGDGVVRFTESGDWGVSRTNQVCFGSGVTPTPTPSPSPSPTPPVDSTAPSVSITSPSAGMVVNGSVSSIVATATASDNVAVSRVDFYLGSALVGSDTSAPYSISIGIANSGSGTQTVGVKSFDAAGNSSPLAQVSIMIDKLAPSAAITSPANGSSSSASSLTISASASDSLTGIQKVEFYQGATLIGSVQSSPYTINWNWSGLAAGTYLLSARAYDGAGNIGYTSDVSVSKVAPVADTTPPLVSITSPVNGTTLSGSVVTISANASDSGSGIQKVEFYRGSTLIGTATLPPYQINWNIKKLSVGTYTLTAKAFDQSGNIAVSAGVSVTKTSGGGGRGNR